MAGKFHQMGNEGKAVLLLGKSVKGVDRCVTEQIGDCAVWIVGKLKVAAEKGVGVCLKSPQSQYPPPLITIGHMFGAVKKPCNAFGAGHLSRPHQQISYISHRHLIRPPPT